MKTKPFILFFLIFYLQGFSQLQPNTVFQYNVSNYFELNPDNPTQNEPSAAIQNKKQLSLEQVTTISLLSQHENKTIEVSVYSVDGSIRSKYLGRINKYWLLTIENKHSYQNKLSIFIVTIDEKKCMWIP